MGGFKALGSKTKINVRSIRKSEIVVAIDKPKRVVCGCSPPSPEWLSTHIGTTKLKSVVSLGREQRVLQGTGK